MNTLFATALATLLLFGGSFAPAAAQVTEATISADGKGVTQEQAIQAALVNAASQAFGVDLHSVTSTNSLSAQTAVDSHSHDLFLSSVNKQITQRLRTPGNAPILGYSVDSAAQLADAEWEASITLRYARYQQLGANTERRSVVVTTQDKRYRDILLKTVEQALISSRRFDVLDRDNQQSYAQETVFIQSGQAALPETARLGQAGGADYLLHASIQGLSVANNQQETIRLTGETLVKSAVSGILKLEIVEFSSRKVKWSGSEKFGATYKGASSVGANSMSGLISNAAEKLVDRLVATIYPMQIVKVMNDTAIVNRGEGSVSKEEHYNVFQMGEDLIDPQSGESLGALEIAIGKGKIIDVKPKFSTLQMLNGQLDPTAQYILRKTAPPAKNRQASTGKRSAQAAPDTARKDTFLR